MSSASYQKGTGYERELVEKYANVGIEAERCWGSDGRSRGLSKKVDLIVRGSIHQQLKRPGSLPKYLRPSSSSSMKVITETSSETTYVSIWLFPHYVRLLDLTPIDPDVEEVSRSRIGNDWKPGNEVVAQVMREDYDTDGDLVVMRQPVFDRMVSTVRSVASD